MERPLWALSENPKFLEWPIICHPRASRTHHARELSRQQRFGHEVVYRGSKREWSWVDLARRAGGVVGLVENVYCNEDGEVVDTRFLYWTDVDDAGSLSRALDRARRRANTHFPGQLCVARRRLLSPLLAIAAAVGSTK